MSSYFVFVVLLKLFVLQEAMQFLTLVEDCEEEEEQEEIECLFQCLDEDSSSSSDVDKKATTLFPFVFFSGCVCMLSLVMLWKGTSYGWQCGEEEEREEGKSQKKQETEEDKS